MSKRPRIYQQKQSESAQFGRRAHMISVSDPYLLFTAMAVLTIGAVTTAAETCTGTVAFSGRSESGILAFPPATASAHATFTLHCNSTTHILSSLMSATTNTRLVYHKNIGYITEDVYSSTQLSHVINSAADATLQLLLPLADTLLNSTTIPAAAKSVAASGRGTVGITMQNPISLEMYIALNNQFESIVRDAFAAQDSQTLKKALWALSFIALIVLIAPAIYVGYRVIGRGDSLGEALGKACNVIRDVTSLCCCRSSRNTGVTQPNFHSYA